MKSHAIKSVKKAFAIVMTCLVLSSCSMMNYHASPGSRRMILRDEGLSQLSYNDLSNPENNWYVPVPAGRDLQLVGQGRVLIGTGTGYEERLISTGEKVAELSSFKGTQTVRRLRNGFTLLAGANWQEKKGIVLVEVDKGGMIKGQIVFPGFSYVRCIRETPQNTFMVTADDVVFEGDDKGNILWRAQIAAAKKPHIWQAVRIANKQTVVSTGYAKSLQIFSSGGKLQKLITAGEEANPNFFAGFQVLKNGNYVVTNWQGHGDKFGSSGTQVLEFSRRGKLVWSWKQDPAKYSSLQGILVLDGLDLSKLHAEDGRGALVPVN